MSTPSDPDRDAPDVDLSSTAGRPAIGDAPFDPYRFGRPDFPVPPEFAPPGYVPDPVPGPPRRRRGVRRRAARRRTSRRRAPYPYGAPPYGAPHPPAYGQSPYGAPPPGYGVLSRPAGRQRQGRHRPDLGHRLDPAVLADAFDIVPVLLALIFGFMALAEAKRRNGGGQGHGRRRPRAAGRSGRFSPSSFTVVVFRAVNKCGGTGSSNDPGFRQCVQDRL